MSAENSGQHTLDFLYNTSGGTKSVMLLSDRHIDTSIPFFGFFLLFEKAYVFICKGSMQSNADWNSITK